MDAYEIMSTVRSFVGIDEESTLPTPVLKQMMNRGMILVANTTASLFHNYLVATKEYDPVTGLSVTLPGDMLHIIDVQRKYDATTYKYTAPVMVEEKSEIGRNPNYTASAEDPLHVHEGRNLLVYPTQTAGATILRYRKKVIELIDGQLTYVSGTTATLGADAVPTDDYYNDYQLAVYTTTRQAVQRIGIYDIADYVGSTKTVTLTGATLSAVKMRYALLPIIPDEFQDLIVEATIVNLKKIKKLYDVIGGDTWAVEQENLNNNMAQMLRGIPKEQ